MERRESTGRDIVECAQALDGVSLNPALPARDWLHRSARDFFDCCVKGPVRNELMNQRSVPGFVSGPGSYAPSVAVMQRFTAGMAFYGITRREDIDLCHRGYHYASRKY